AFRNQGTVGFYLAAYLCMKCKNKIRRMGWENFLKGGFLLQPGKIGLASMNRAAGRKISHK
ncbi:MAG TPA: hypothetical protein VEB42_05935, partial [Chitinophagaceae bacterium]|nr:hypothetical protein [Chitinophagaceae bacterium]